MTSLEDVIRSLLFRRPTDTPPVRDAERLGEGVFHIDHHDPDHVYLVSVRQVPRVALPFEGTPIVGEAEGVRAVLVRVALANHIEVTADAEPGPAREAALSDFRNRYAGWERQPTTEPPSWPAEEFMRTKVSASDDAGTAYRFASGQAGGTGTEWEARWRLLPTPPAGARRLTLHFAPPGGPAVDVDFALPTD